MSAGRRSLGDEVRSVPAGTSWESRGAYMREVVVFVEDVFYTAKIRETARSVARDVRFIRDH